MICQTKGCEMSLHGFMCERVIQVSSLKWLEKSSFLCNSNGSCWPKVACLSFDSRLHTKECERAYQSKDCEMICQTKGCEMALHRFMCERVIQVKSLKWV